MTLTPVGLTVDGVVIDLHDVSADVTIHHGRTGYFDEAQASTCQVTLLDVAQAFTRPFRLGVPMVLTVQDGAGPVHPRFTGRCTDALLDVDDITIIAVGRLSTLSGYIVGAVDYPAETWSARVTRLFTDAGLAAYLELAAPVPERALLARPAEPVALAAYLGDLAAMIGAAIADRPDGKIMVQPISSRVLALTVLDPAEVAYAPVWTQNLPATNQVTVSYGAALAVTAQDADSVALYGPRPSTVDTELSSAADADAIARAIVARQAYAHWTIGAAPLLVGRDIAIGSALNLHTLPDAAPYDPWTPVLEGWTDSILSDGTELDWTMELALSDPLLSGLTLPWNLVPLDAAHNWDTINPATAWRDALTLDSL